MLNLVIRHGQSEKIYKAISADEIISRVQKQLDLDKDYDFSEDYSFSCDYDERAVKINFYAANSRDTVEFVVMGEDQAVEDLFSKEETEFWENACYFLADEISA